ncbi:MAG: hypothetical protein L3J66_08135 [Bacteroidales bacterium]|nr:hypothetical protein [Bacteroidales bacterium]
MKTLNKKKLYYWIYMLGVIVLIFAAFNSYVTFQVHNQLSELVKKPGRWPVGAYVFEPKIGFDFAPGISGPVSDHSFYVKSHRLGYRIGETQDASAFSPGGILSLGCSLTYGDEVNAGQTFTQLIADSLHLPAYNYGVCSFSYIHALVKAQNLRDDGILNKLQPKYVILGCWNGLPARSKTPFPPIASKNIPLTAAYLDHDGSKLSIQYPSSSKLFFELATMYRKEGAEMNFGKFFKIFFAIPRFAFVYLKNNQLLQKMKGGHIENTLSDYALYNFYFSEIEKVFAPFNSKLIVLYMPVKEQEHPGEALTKALSNHQDIAFVNGAQAIKNYHIPKTEYKGKHPQPAAHMAYAREAIRLLKSLQKKKGKQDNSLISNQAEK